MKFPLLKGIMILLPACTAVSAKADYTPDFSTGLIPAGVTVANESGFSPVESYYKHGWTADGWTVERFGSKGFVLVAPSHTGEAEPKAMRSVLTLPVTDITEATWLRWDACSMIPDMPEAYHVEISPEGSDEVVTVFSIDSEASDWTTRMVSLAAFAGKKCRISFVCSSVNRYELMLDKISVTEPKQPVWAAKNATPWFGDLSGTEISGTITNVGSPAEVSAVLLLDGEGNETARSVVDRIVATAGSLDFSFHGAAEKDARTRYSVSLLLADGTISAIKDLEGSYFSSFFTRKHLVDKGTGMWCVNCPTGNLQFETLEHRFGSLLIPVETHVSDDLANADYFSALKMFGIPAFRMDRNKKGNNNFSDMESFYDVPANHEVVFDKVSLSDPGQLGLRVVVRHPRTETAGFKLGYVITADFSSPEYYQKNNTSTTTGGRYYFLPSLIPGDMLEFKHVSVTSEHAFEGIEANSVYEADGMIYSVFEFTVPKPALLDDFRGATAVAFALDDETSLILNASSVLLDKDFELSGVEDVISENTGAEGPAEYYTLQGIRVANPSQGIFICRQGNKSSKIILK